MKHIFLYLLLFALSPKFCYSTIHTIVNSGTTFVPSTININLGDTVKFVLESIHNVVEVSEATWNANQSTSNCGFVLPFGGGTLVLSEIKKYYYVCQPHASFGMKGTITVLQPTDVINKNEKIADEFVLHQNYPNPFNPETEITFSIPATELVTLKVYNLLGQEVQTLIDEVKPLGTYNIKWNAENKSSGIYFYQLKSSSHVQTKRMIISK